MGQLSSAKGICAQKALQGWDRLERNRKLTS
jgi:hypothetical protein